MRKVMAIVVVIIACTLAFTACGDVADIPESELIGDVILSNHAPKVGETITAIYNRCNGTGEQTWRWYHADTNALINGAAASTYTATAGDVGKKLRVQLSFAHQIGSLSAVTIGEVAAATGSGSNPGDGETGPTGSGEPDVDPVDPVLARFLGWQWEKPSDGFVWVFNNNGTIFGIHHCGEGWDNFSYLIRGGILITYGSEMDDDELIVTSFIMAEDGASFTRINGSQQTLFVRGEAVTGPSAQPPLVLSNALVGTWQQTDGTEYTFSSNAELKIISPSGSGEYGYLVRGSKLVTLPLKEYQFKRMGNSLELTPSGGAMITLSLKK